VTTTEALQALLAAIETAVATADVDCEINMYRVTAGQAAAPAGQCNVVSVWASQAFNSVDGMFHADNSCTVVRGVALHWRLDLCYGETAEERTPEDHLTTATCLYTLADAIWCGLNTEIGAGRLFATKCADLQVDALSYNEASGGGVSADSGMRLQMECDLEPES
jgi:hypothetical protein